MGPFFISVVLKMSDNVEGRVWRFIRRIDIFASHKIRDLADWLYFVRRPRPEMRGSLRHFMREKEAGVVDYAKNHWTVNNFAVNTAASVAKTTYKTVFFWYYRINVIVSYDFSKQ